jgi:hypothetical protein
MTFRVPVRTSLVWLGLMAATFVTWWLGTGHAGERGASWEVLSLIVIACVKIHCVGYEFMELRAAPIGLRAAFTLWLTTLGVASAALALA